jgi:protein-S-isoprenylcysteine O-methyltransferase Ste14
MFKKVLPPTCLYLAIIVILLLHFFFPIANVIPTPWNYLGAIPFVLGVTLNFIADHSFKKYGTTVKPFEESSVLITTGVYQVSRNPMYLGFVLMLIGIVIFQVSLAPYVVVVVFAVLMDIGFIGSEERMLEKKFCTAWLDYKRKVRRWI